MGFVLVLLFAAAFGQRPGSGNSEPLCQYSKFPPSDAMYFSLFLDQTGEDLLCEPFLFGLAQAMGNTVDMEQIGLSSACHARLLTFSFPQRSPMSRCSPYG